MVAMIFLGEAVYLMLHAIHEKIQTLNCHSAPSIEPQLFLVVVVASKGCCKGYYQALCKDTF